MTLDMDRREVVHNKDVSMPYHDVQIAVVCQEGCYPDKKAHVNQDCYVLETEFEGDKAQLLLGVFDGHGGSGEHCAQIASSIFPKKLEVCRKDKTLEAHGGREAPVPSDAERTAYAKAFTESNETVVRELGDSARSSGTTAVVAHVIGDMLHLGNVGDSRAILGVNAVVAGAPHSSSSSLSSSSRSTRSWQVVEVTHDQTCFRNDERERMRRDAREPVMFATLGMILGEVPMSDDFGEETIEAADDPPRVFRNGESYPGCAFTRSLGDTIGKNLGVSADPELLTYQLDSSVRCLVIASDGVFEFMENDEVMAIAEKHWGDPFTACEEIVATAYDHWATEDTRSDDVTCVVAYFTPKEGAVEPSSQTAAAGLTTQSVAKRNWKKIQGVVRAGAIKNRPALRFANAVLAKVAIDLRRRRGSIAMEELFPDFEWDKVSELKRMASLKGGLKMTKLSLQDP